MSFGDLIGKLQSVVSSFGTEQTKKTGKKETILSIVLFHLRKRRHLCSWRQEAALKLLTSSACFTPILFRWVPVSDILEILTSCWVYELSYVLQRDLLCPGG